MIENQIMGTWDKTILVSEFEEFAEDFPNYTRSQQFELFTANWVLRPFEYEAFDLESGRVGKGQDGGIDWIYFVINDQVVSDLSQDIADQLPKNATIQVFIGQAKEEDGFKAAVGDKLHSTFSELFTAEELNPTRQYDPDLLQKVASFREFYFRAARKKPEMQFHIYYGTVSSRPAHPDVVQSFKIAVNALEGAFSNAIVTSNLIEAAEAIKILNQIPQYNTDLRYESELESKTGKVALVSLSEYFKFLRDDSGKINAHFFEANVRDFEGSNVKVNKGIAESLNNPEDCRDFWWLNNGITMLVSEPPVSRERTYTLQDVQIVNGLQTSYSIYEFFKSNSLALKHEERQVLVRILVPNDEDEKSHIIRATNSQTSVQTASLRATDEIHRKIEQLLHIEGLHYERRKNYYKNQKISPKKIVSITLLSQSMMAAILMQPDTARARPSSFLNDDALYDKIFKNQDLGLYSWCARNQKKVEQVLASIPELSISDRNNFRFYVLLLARVLGHFRYTNHLAWSIKCCKNDWNPTADEIYSLSIWVKQIAEMKIARQPQTLDKLCKGSEFLPFLKENWESLVQPPILDKESDELFEV